jgi:hypothetical protein
MIQKFKSNKIAASTSTTSELIYLNSYFATLLNETDEHYEFEFTFGVKWTDIVKKDIQKFSIDIFNNDVIRTSDGKKQIAPQQKLFKVNNKPSFQPGVSKTNAILQGAINAFGDVKEKNDSMIASTSKLFLMTPEYASFLQVLKNKFKTSGKFPEGSVNFPFPLLSLKTKNVFAPIENSTATASSLKHKNLALIGENLIDPALAIAKDVSQDSNARKIINEIRDFYRNGAIIGLPKEEYYYETEYSRNQPLSHFYRTSSVLIPKKLVINSVDVVFSLYTGGNNQEILVAQSKKKLDAKKHSKFLKYPYKKLPVGPTTSNLVSVSPWFEAKHSIVVGDAVMAKNQKLDSLKIETKKIDKHGVCQDKAYNMIKGLEYLNYVTTSENFVIQRSFAVNSESTSTSQYFDSCVVGQAAKIDTSVLIITKVKNEPTYVRINNIPPYVASGKIEKKIWNNENHSGFSLVEITNFSNLNSNFFEYVDRNLIDGRLYLYSVTYVTHQGDALNSVEQYHQCKLGLEDKYNVTTTLVNFEISVNENETRVSFQVNSEIQKPSTEQINQLLRDTTISSQFTQQMSQELQDNFGLILSHKVVRLDMTTGTREIFDSVTQTLSGLGSQIFIDDKSTRLLNNVSKFDPTHSYVYELNTAVSDPKTLVRDLVVNSQLKPYGKSYSFRPYRWYQQQVKEKGTLYAEDEKGNLIGFDPFSENNQGVSFKKELPSSIRYEFLQPKNLFVERVNKKLVRIAWDVQLMDNYDHFVVIKEVGGQRKLMGAFFTNELYDDLRLEQSDVNNNQHDFGTVIYYVVPVFKDFSVGNAIKSNSITVDPLEFQYHQG